MKIDKLILFGGGPVLIECIDIAREVNWNVIVYTSKRHLEAPVVINGEKLSTNLNQRNVDFVVTENISKESEFGSEIGNSIIGISFDAPWIFTKEFIDRFQGRLFNSHGMRLPQFRGGGGYTWPILKGTKMGYSILHEVTPGIDDGPIIYMKEYKFDSSCVIPQDFFDDAIRNDKLMMSDFLFEIASGNSWSTYPQTEYLSTYFPRLYSQIHGAINWDWNTGDLIRFMRSFDHPYPGAFSIVDHKKVFLQEVSLANSDGPFHPYQAGIVYRRDNEVHYVASRKMGIRVGKLLLEDGTTLLKVGTRIYTPRSVLNKSYTYRARYGPNGLL